MSVHNGEPYVAESVRSMLAQTYRDFEFLIADDASSDGTSEILKRFAAQDTRVRVFRFDEKRGLTQVLNWLLSHARGELIARMDADDISLPTRLEEQVNVFESGDVDVCFARAVIIDAQGNEICERWQPSDVATTLAALPWICHIAHPSTMFRAAAVFEAGGYDPNFVTGQDWDLWIRLRRLRKTFHLIPHVLIKYRLNPGSIRCNNGGSTSSKTLADVCVSNNTRLRAMRYWPNLTSGERLRLLGQCIIPFALRRLRHRIAYRGLSKIHHSWPAI